MPPSLSRAIVEPTTFTIPYVRAPRALDLHERRPHAPEEGRFVERRVARAQRGDGVVVAVPLEGLDALDLAVRQGDLGLVVDADLAVLKGLRTLSLAGTKVDDLTPMQAFELLREWKTKWGK